MNRKTLFMIVGLMVVALAVVGVGYALWFEDLKIHGEVTTGDLDIDFSPFEVYEHFDFCDNDPLTVDVPDCPPNKLEEVDCAAFFNYGWMGAQEGDVEIIPADELTGEMGDPDYLGITVDGAYPSYTCQVTFDITSNGSVPVHLFAWYVAPEAMAFPEPPLECTIDGQWADVTIDLATGQLMLGTDPVQLHEGDSIDCRVNLHFTNDDDVLEGETYTFQYHFRGCQWNEADYDTCVAPPFDQPPG